jgi:hypothetical protein
MNTDLYRLVCIHKYRNYKELQTWNLVAIPVLSYKKHIQWLLFSYQSYDIKLSGHSNHKILECPETYFSAGISGTIGQYGF